MITKVAGTWTPWLHCTFNIELVSAFHLNMFLHHSITKKSGVKSKIKPPPPPSTRILDAHSFDAVALVCCLNISNSSVHLITSA